MIKQLQGLNPNITNLVVYCDSPSLQYELLKLLQKIADCNSDTILSVESAKDLNDAKATILTAPFWGGKWFIDVNCDKLSMSDIVSSFRTESPFSLKVHWVTKYAQYKKLKDLDVVKKNKVKVSFYYMGKLSYDGILRLHDMYKVSEDEPLLDSKLLKFVAKNYNYDVQGVCDLFTLLRSGNEVKTNKDIVELIGVGGNSIDKFLIKVLTTSYNTEKGLKMVISKRLKLLNDLSISYNYGTIKRIMESNLDGLITLKQLQIMGKLNKLTTEVPDAFNPKKLQRLRRYEGILKDEISLPMLLNFKMLLNKHNTYNAEHDLVLAIYEYIVMRSKVKVV